MWWCPSRLPHVRVMVAEFARLGLTLRLSSLAAAMAQLCSESFTVGSNSEPVFWNAVSPVAAGQVVWLAECGDCTAEFEKALLTFIM